MNEKEIWTKELSFYKAICPYSHTALNKHDINGNSSFTLDYCCNKCDIKSGIKDHIIKCKICHMSCKIIEKNTQYKPSPIILKPIINII